MIPGKGILDLLTSASGVADSFVTLSEDYELLKTAVKDMETALEKYKTEYNNFSGKVSSYLSTTAEMNSELRRLQTAIDSASVSVSSITSQIEDLESQILELEKDTEENGTNHDEEIKALQDELDAIQEDNKEALKAYNTAVSNYNSKKQYYENKLNSIRSEIISAKASYISAIDSLISKSTDTEKKLQTVQGDITNVGSQLGGTIVNGATLSWKEQRDKIDQQISQLEKAKGETQDPAEIKQYNDQIVALKEEKLEYSNPVKIAEAEEKGFEEAMKTMKVNIADADLAVYSSYVEKLRTLKNRVNDYLKDENESVSAISEADFFVSVPSGLLTYAKVEEAEKDLLEACTKSTIWGIVNAITSFIKALFSLSVVFAPELNAIIDSNAYSGENALPSEKDRSLYPLNYGEAGDAALSDYYKSLYGDYAWTDGSVTSNFNFIQTLGAIFTDLVFC